MFIIQSIEIFVSVLHKFQNDIHIETNKFNFHTGFLEKFNNYHFNSF